MKNLFLGAILAGSTMFLGACVGYVEGGSPDYYGPVYGGAVFYGHPEYREHDDVHVFIGGPPERHWRR